MRWLNKYHKGFNRLWLLFSCLLAFAFVGLRWWGGVYKPRIEPPVHDAILLPRRPGQKPKPKQTTEAEKQKKEDELKAYQTRQEWIERGRTVRDLLGSFIITFAMGHGVFLVVWWIIRGFR